MKRPKVVISLAILIVVFVIYLALNISAGSRTIEETIIIAENEVYDGKGETIIAVGMGDGSQKEQQKPLFILEKGATLKNITISNPGCAGIYCIGDNTLESVIWEDVGKTALTVIGDETNKTGKIYVSDCKLYNSEVSVFDLNKECDFILDNIYVDNFDILINENGFKNNSKISINDCTIKNGESIGYTFKGSNKVSLKNNIIENVTESWISEGLETDLVNTSAAKATTKKTTTPKNTEQKTNTNSIEVTEKPNEEVVKIDYKIISKWQNGASVQINITNISNKVIKDWKMTLEFKNDEQIREAWGAVYSDNGNGIQLYPENHLKTINPNETITNNNLGFNLQFNEDTSEDVKVIFEVLEWF